MSNRRASSASPGESRRREHPAPRQVGAGGEELGARSGARGRRLGEVGVGLAVATENGGQSTEVVADGALGSRASGGPLIGPRGEVVEQLACVSAVPAFDGGFSAVDHGQGPVHVHREVEARRREFRQELPGLVELAGVSVGHGLYRHCHLMGNVRHIGVQLVQKWDQFHDRSALPDDIEELPSIEDGGVWLSAVNADLERLVGQLLALVGVAGGQ